MKQNDIEILVPRYKFDEMTDKISCETIATNMNDLKIQLEADKLIDWLKYEIKETFPDKSEDEVLDILLRVIQTARKARENKA